MTTTSETSYREHLWGRELASMLQIPLLYMSSAGQYRVNLGVFQGGAGNPAFSFEKGGSLYRSETKSGAISQRLFFLPESLRGKSLASESLMQLRQSGSALQSYAGYGLQVPTLFRLGINLKTLLNADFWRDAPECPAEFTAVVSDTLALAGGVVQSHFYNMALSQLRSGQELSALQWFSRNHLTHFGTGALQMVAGLLRLGREVQSYGNTGEFRPSIAFFAALDIAGGSSGIWYSQYLLKKAAQAGLSNSARNDALMGIAKLPAGMRVGMRVLGLSGSIVGLGANLHAFYQAYQDVSVPDSERKRQMISAGVGITGSAMLVGSALLVCPATAPVAGLLMVGGLTMIGIQSLFF